MKFTKVAYKKLAAGEADANVSNQHEFNGASGFRSVLGSARFELDATWHYRADEEDSSAEDIAKLTWYDSRENQSDRNAEYRLYYKGNGVSALMKEGDLMCLTQDDSGCWHVFIAQSGSTAEAQLTKLFHLTDISQTVQANIIIPDSSPIIRDLILEDLGQSVIVPDDALLEEMMGTFDGKFPPTAAFSEFVQTHFPSTDLSADETFLRWFHKEQELFEAFEKSIIEPRIKAGFNAVKDFLQYSLSVQNRRKSRAGYAAENHLEAIFTNRGIQYSRGELTENNNRPDFIFPSIADYRNDKFPTKNLAMLAVKTTCKDRWRQILPEAERIDEKHLFTIEPSISTKQTSQMSNEDVSLVLPEELHQSYTATQQKSLLTLEEFIGVLS